MMYVGFGIAYLSDHSTLCDRHSLLMLRDLATARFQSLIFGENVYTNEYGPTHIPGMIALYAAGDRLLKKYGNQTYKGIKLLEPYVHTPDERSRTRDTTTDSTVHPIS